MKKVESLKFPGNLMMILKDEGFWEDDSFDPILITVEEVHYKGLDKISYEASFGLLDAFADMDGFEWEDVVRAYVKEKNPFLESRMIGESEEDVCVFWTDDPDNFRIMLGLMQELINDPDTVGRLRVVEE
jgi:hypothetical protein